MGTFSWCQPVENRHNLCLRSYEKFVIDIKTNKPVYLGVTVRCECSKRGCPCYVKKSEQTKRKPRRRR